jgi:hypothetical protein
MPILRKRIELTFGVDIYATHNSSNNVSSNLIDQCYLRKVYDYIIGDVFKNISFEEFKGCVAKRDFSNIYYSEGSKCAMTKYLIYILGKHIDDESWYRDVAHSINTEPQKCSGASVPPLWRKNLNSIRA